MAKHWTLEEDKFLVEFYDAVGSFIGPHDLGRSEASTKARVQKLKETGAWQALENLGQAERDYLKKYHLCLGHELPVFLEDDEANKPSLKIVK